MKYSETFKTYTEKWICEMEQHGSQKLELSENMATTDLGEMCEQFKSMDNREDELGPADSASNIEINKASVSQCSTASSARVRAEAELAVLTTRQKLLEEKHALEEEEERLRKRKEKLQLETEIAEKMAKLSIFKSRSTTSGRLSKVSNGMNSYIERKNPQTLNVSAEEFIPSHTILPNAIKNDKSYPSACTRMKNMRPANAQCSNAYTANEEDVTNRSEVMGIMRRQNEITTMLIQQQCLTALPKREIPMFDGDPLKYYTFINAFENGVEKNTNNNSDRLYYMEQHTKGYAKELVRSCQHLNPEYGYAKAKSLLKEHFGNEHKVAAAYMNRALSWPTIRPDEVSALQDYSLFLWSCCTAMEEVQYLHDLDMPSNMLNVISKLPYKLKDKWRSQVCELQERQQRRAKFSDITDFIEKQVKILTDPVFGCIQDANTTSSKGTNRQRLSSRSGGASFATTVDPVEYGPQSASDKKDIMAVRERNACLYCGAGHTLDMCAQLGKIAHEEKIRFLKENGICFGCLGTGHISRYCRKRLSCIKCDFKHPTVLHKKYSYDNAEQGSAELHEENMLVSSGLTGAGDQDCKLPIVPVQVKSKKGTKIVTTYAFLDQGSTAVFCTDSLMNKLNLTGRKGNILLRTMGQERIVSSNMVTGLEVAALDGEEFIELPKAYTQVSMPVYIENIPTKGDIKKWPHLKHVHLPQIEGEIELLIGTNVPKALEPLEVVCSVNGGPFAIRTKLGWTVNGPLGEECGEGGQPTITVNRVSVVTLDELWQQQFKNDFPETILDEQLALSREDHQFLESVTKTTKQVNGHYQISLPLKQSKIDMPNNRKLVEQRLNQLKGRMQKDQAFYTEYVAFMSELLQKGYAEKVPEEEIVGEKGRVWYIPHHGVFHPTKKKIRVVFECGASFQGASLNAQLLQATEEEAVSLYHELISLCSKGGFSLTKWTSNRPAVMQVIPDCHRAKCMKLDMELDSVSAERVLGVEWCIKSDVFKFKVAVKARPSTRRGMLSIIASVYDPLGMLSPVILKAKIILRDLCRMEVGWDDVVPEPIAQRWDRFVQQLHLLNEYKVNRCLKPKFFGNVCSARLHHFCDASENGYGVVTYLVSSNSQSEQFSAFVMGKSRVAPLKLVSIPRMELVAATLASRMDVLWRKELQMKLMDSIFWTDSESVIKYIQNETSRYKVFVANRVSQILNVSSGAQWRYVSTASNPADIASRGVKVDTFMKHPIWLTGPGFLLQPESEWPILCPQKWSLSSEDPELRRIAVMNVVQMEEQVISQLIEYFSSWTRLRKCVAWILRIKDWLLSCVRKRRQLHNALAMSELDQEQRKSLVNQEMAKFKKITMDSNLTVVDLEKAELAIVKHCQRNIFPEELSCLEKQQPIKPSSHIRKLCPQLQDGVLRVGGRLCRLAMPVEVKHPIILTKNLHVTELLLRHIHQEVGHGGRNHMLSKLRERYWVTGAGTAIRKVLSRCIICRRVNSQPVHQQMAELPQERVVPDEPPFTRVGVDYFGPFEVKSRRSTVKRYGVIFTCLAIRAIHIEVAPSLDTDSFINALRRFVARRGQVREIRSDNGTNFIGAERELRSSIEQWNMEQINKVMMQKGISWSFNVPAGSHHGGVWERLIRSVRKVLNSTLKVQYLDEEGLHTVLCEAEAIINGRPLTQASMDVNDLEALTPSHLLLLKTSPSLPPGVFQSADMYATRRWKQVQYIADLFWKRWVKEYLPLLQERQKWSGVKRNLSVGDLVLIMDNTAPRNSWLMGRVIQVYPDKRGLVRQVKIKTRTSCLDRPITKVCLLQEVEAS
ncbi:hypothetical protein WMY93_000059 [Mugilogobius chulae]|uniref:Integrase catalytic domain-containing protein n=1 Tax=Mugilogobius chulae TaxID=88201 RepID=A0AAW0PYB6_9GOBI